MLQIANNVIKVLIWFKIIYVVKIIMSIWMECVNRTAIKATSTIAMFVRNAVWVVYNVWIVKIIHVHYVKTTMFY
jgi:hypothetical protein